MLLEPKTRVSPGRPELANHAGGTYRRRYSARARPISRRMLPHHHTRVKADMCRDLLNTEIGLFQQAASGQNPLLGEPLVRRGPNLGSEPPGKGPVAHRGAPSQGGRGVMMFPSSTWSARGSSNARG
jgi:hypothetical protein